MHDVSRHVLISGCSGGGKSSLLDLLSAHGFATVEEPGRRIIREEEARGGSALPWIDLPAFARRAPTLALQDRMAMATQSGWVLFDRGLVDAAVALEHVAGESAATLLADAEPYHHRVFLTPPWPEIYRQDGDRRHDLAAAIADYDRLAAALPKLGYQVIILPKISVEDRMDFLLDCLDTAH